ncbi:MAG: isochorismatase family cysteine hydrolase [Galbitalea sp.]
MPTNFESWMAGEDREPFDLPATPTALIVVDMQNWYTKDIPGVEERPGFGREGFRKAVPGVLRLVDAARAAGHMIVYTRYTYMDDFADRLEPWGRPREPMRGITGQLAGEYANEVIDEITVREGEIVIDKSRPSSFYGTRLEPLLTARGIKNVVVCGVTTNICVETTARDAHQRGYNTFVVEDATGEFEESRHWHSLYTIAWCFGTVVTVADAERSWVPVPSLAVAG